MLLLVLSLENAPFKRVPQLVNPADMVSIMSCEVSGVRCSGLDGSDKAGASENEIGDWYGEDGGAYF